MLGWSNCRMHGERHDAPCIRNVGHGKVRDLLRDVVQDLANTCTGVSEAYTDNVVFLKFCRCASQK